MRKLLLLLLLACGGAFAAPSIDCTPSRTSGTAPLAVFMDCTATTGVTFHTGLFTHSVADANALTWTYGAAAGKKRNFMLGPIASYVFESATGSPFSWKICASDGTTNSCTTKTITVTAANTTFSQANTKCFYQSTPTGTCPNNGAESQNADFDDALSTCLGSGKRCLFKGGDTFTASIHTTFTGATAQVGSYGTGKAKINGSPGASGFFYIALTNSDLRITDLEFDGDATSGQVLMTFQNTAWTDFLFLNNYAHGYASFLNGVNWASSGGSGFYAVNNRLENPETGGTADMILVSEGSVISVQGNNLAMNQQGQQVLRSNINNKFILSNNTLSGAGVSPGNEKETIGIRSGVAASSQYGVVADNSITLGAGYVGIYPSSAATFLGIFDLVIERNYIYGSVAAASPGVGIASGAERISIRNNLIDASDVDMSTGISLGGTAGGLSLPAKDNFVYNNTIYTSQVSGSLNAVFVDTTASTGNVVKNNLVYSSGITATAVSDSGAVATKSNNTSEGTGAGSVKTNPFIATPTNTLSTWQPSASAYAYNAGTALYPATASDFFNCFDKTAAQYRIGAVVTRSLAICTGAP